jgi:hypothetical protein
MGISKTETAGVHLPKQIPTYFSEKGSKGPVLVAVFISCFVTITESLNLH